MTDINRFKPPHVTLSNWREPEHIKWALRHFSFMPTLDIARSGPVSEMPSAPRTDVEAFRFEHAGCETTLLDALHGDSVDGYIVIKDGKVLYERYFGAFQSHDKHLWASATKSIIGSLFGILVSDFGVDLSRSPADYVMQLEGSAFASMSLRQMLNMVSALEFTEEYDDMVPGSVHLEYFRRLGLVPAWDLMQSDPRQDFTPRGARGYLPVFQQNPALEIGNTFEYHSPNVDVAGWVIEAVTQMPLVEFVRTYLWSELETEHDAFMSADTEFNPIATGGFNSTLRDAARVGLMALNEGRCGDRQIIDGNWMADTYALTEQDRAAWQNSVFADPQAITYMPDYEGYRSFWWICDANKGERAAMGIYGQMVYVNKSTNTVIASFSSPNYVSNVRRPSFKAVVRGNRALAAAL
ncbi:MAG: serine hydrolase domain-containing protein [Pikeienuella sp.]